MALGTSIEAGVEGSFSPDGAYLPTIDKVFSQLDDLKIIGGGKYINALSAVGIDVAQQLIQERFPGNPETQEAEALRLLARMAFIGYDAKAKGFEPVASLVDLHELVQVPRVIVTADGSVFLGEKRKEKDIVSPPLLSSLVPYAGDRDKIEPSPFDIVDGKVVLEQPRYSAPVICAFVRRVPYTSSATADVLLTNFHNHLKGGFGEIDRRVVKQTRPSLTPAKAAS